MKTIAGIGRIFYALPLLVFGLLHFINGPSMSGVVPSFIPGGVFWVYFTGLCLMAAAVSIIINKYARLATLLLAVMLLIFVVTIHLPAVLHPHNFQFSMTMLLKDLALAGAAMVIASVSKN